MLFPEKDLALVAYGSMVSCAEHIRQKIRKEGGSCTLVNGRFVKPVDFAVLDKLAENHSVIVTLEENVLRGGAGEEITTYIHAHYPAIRVINIGLPDTYVEHGSVSVLRATLGIDSDSIIERLRKEKVI